MKNLNLLPDNLPIPVDDGACEHLEGIQFPSIVLLSTSGKKVDIGSQGEIVVVYFHPLIGRPDSPPMVGWNEIPGARGCTPQSCAFRDLHSELLELGAIVYGASSQTHPAQVEASQRLHLPFELVSDASFELAVALKLPVFEYNSSPFIKRLTLIIKNGIICKVFYPVFPSNENAANVIAWLKENQA
jgi:peroxiredoxin